MNRVKKENQLYRDDILRAKKAALNKTNADLISRNVKSAATVGRTLRGENVDLLTLKSIADDLGVPMNELFIFDENIAVAG